MDNITLTADLHIDLRRKGVPPSWEKQRLKLMVEQLPLQPLIIGGDVFNRIPTLEELDLFLNLMTRFKDVPVLIYPGNHEMLSKTKSCFPQLETAFKAVCQHPESCIIEAPTNSVKFAGQVFDVLPYTGVKNYKDFKPVENVLLSHFRASIPPHVLPEVDLEYFKQWEVVYLGDLHSHSNTQGNLIYPGSPVTTSFHRALTASGYLEICGTSWKYFDFAIELPQLLRKTISDPKDAIPDDFHFVTYEIEGSAVELAEVKLDETITKKVKPKAKEIALVLEPGMSEFEKLKEYLLYVIQLDEAEASEVANLYLEVK